MWKFFNCVVRKGVLSTVKYLINEKLIDINLSTMGSQILHGAAEGQEDIVTFLLDNGAAIDAVDSGGKNGTSFVLL